jgi:acylphosphatase
MRMTGYLVVPLLAVALAIGPAIRTAAGANAAPEAISASVSGNVQKVGFRAMILKQAIEYNLAGSAKNNPDGTVQFSLQGEEHRIDQAVMAIRKGTKKSSNVKVDVSPSAVDPNLNKFTVIAWTSTSRHITNPYDLVFTLRTDDKTISKKEAKEVYHEILRTTLKDEDLSKLGDADDD